MALLGHRPLKQKPKALRPRALADILIFPLRTFPGATLVPDPAMLESPGEFLQMCVQLLIKLVLELVIVFLVEVLPPFYEMVGVPIDEEIVHVALD